MAVKLHRCSTKWKVGPCWRVQKALDEQGIDYARRAGNARSRSRSNAHRPRPSKRRHALEPQTGDRREQTDQTTAAGRGLKLWLQVKAFPAPCRSSEERDR